MFKRINLEEAKAVIEALQEAVDNLEQPKPAVDRKAEFKKQMEAQKFVTRQVSSNAWVVGLCREATSTEREIFKEVARFEPYEDEIDTPKHRAEVVEVAMNDLCEKALASALERFDG